MKMGYKLIQRFFIWTDNTALYPVASFFFAQYIITANLVQQSVRPLNRNAIMNQMMNQQQNQIRT